MDDKNDAADPVVEVDGGGEFRREIRDLINRHSMENGSNTPDWVLAEYLANCLKVFDDAVLLREEWYGRGEVAVETAQ